MVGIIFIGIKYYVSCPSKNKVLPELNRIEWPVMFSG
jgi:hypothetical protein